MWRKGGKKGSPGAPPAGAEPAAEVEEAHPAPRFFFLPGGKKNTLSPMAEPRARHHAAALVRLGAGLLVLHREHVERTVRLAVPVARADLFPGGIVLLAM